METSIKASILVTLFGAVVGGVISFGPWILDRITAPKAEIEYRVLEGPPIPLQGEFKKTYVLNVRNTGSKEINSVVCVIRLNRGKIDEASHSETMGVKISEKRNGPEYVIEAQNLNPSETINLAVLYTVLSSDITPEVAVRGIGAVVKKAPEPNRNEQNVSILTVMIGVLAAAIIPIWFIRIRSVLGIGLAGGKSYDSGNRSENLQYIFGRLGLLDWFIAHARANDRISYRGVADNIAAQIDSVDADKRRTFLKAIKAILVIGNINENSRQVVKRAIRIIEKDKYSDDEIKMIESMMVKGDPIKLRDNIDQVLSKLS